VQASRPEVLKIAVSVKSKKVFMTGSFQYPLIRRNEKPKQSCAADLTDQARIIADPI